MKERTSAYETIKNPSGETLATVLITSSSKVVNNLMGDHYIQLDFTLDNAINFPVGSYIDDEIFGRFFITEEQMPTYDNKTTGYRYELKFNAWYKLWGNKQMMLTNIGTSFRKRTEANWSLTKDLQGHALEIVHNLQVMGFVRRNIAGKLTDRYTNNIVAYRATDANGKYSLQFISQYDTNIGVCIRVRYYSTYTDDDGVICHDSYEENNYIFPNQNSSIPSCATGYTDYNGEDFEIIGVYPFTGVIEDSDDPEGLTVKYLSSTNSISQEFWYYEPNVTSRGLSFDYGVVTYNISSQMNLGLEAAKTALGIDTPCDYEVVSKAIFYDNEDDGISGYFNLGYPLRNAKYYLPSFYMYMWCGKSNAADYTDGIMMFATSKSALQNMTVYNPNSLSLDECTQFLVMNVNVLTIDRTAQSAYPTDTTFADFKTSATAKDATFGDSTIISNESHLSFTVQVIKDITEATDLVDTLVNGYKTARKESIEYEHTSAEDFSGEYSDAQLAADFISIDSANIDKYKDALTLSYKGTKITDALKSIADTFECEWWIEYENEQSKKIPVTDSQYPAFKICFGKLEKGIEQTLELNGNVESMSIKKDNSIPPSKLYAFGSTDNIPYSYRKSIYLNIKKDSSSGNYYLQMEGITKGYKGLVDPSWFGAEKATPSTIIATSSQSSTLAKTNLRNNGTMAYQVLQSLGNIHLNTGDYRFDTVTNTIASAKFIINTDKSWSTFNKDAEKQWDEETQSYILVNQDYLMVDMGIFLKGIDGTIYEMTYTRENVEGAYKVYNDAAALEFKSSSKERPTLTDLRRVPSGNYDVFFGIVVSCYCQSQTWLEKAVIENLNITVNSFALSQTSLSLLGTDADTGAIDIEYNNTTYSLTLNPSGATRPAVKSPTSEYFQCVLTDGTQPFAGGELVKIMSKTDNINIPSMYFTSEYDNPSALYQLGDRRLMLPENSNPDDVGNWDDAENPQFVCLNGAIVPYAYRNNPDSYDLTENTVCFDNEYPNGKLQITSITTEDKDTKTETEGETEMYSWKWLQYHLNLATVEGASLIFDKQYILEGYELGIRFLTPTDISAYNITPAIAIDTENGCKLCGMQFEIEFNDSVSYKESGSESYTSHTQDYAIVRNEDFGAKLPSEILHPTVGDPVCLINWDVRALSSLGLIDAAEKNLRTKAFEYMHALQEGNFTFDCNMMSAYMFNLYGEYISLGDADNKNLVEGGGAYLMVRNGFDIYAIPSLGQKVCIEHDSLSSSKHTRVIGYEYKLDKPYDTPKLTCGETEAYSRLKQIEKEISKLS